MSRLRVLITGAAGFIGAHVTRSLLEQEARLTLLARPSSELGRLWRVAGKRLDRTELRRVDLGAAEAVRAEMQRARPEVVIHLAADPRARASEDEAEAMRALHVDATRVLAEASIELGARLVVVSTSDVYGKLPSPHDAEGEVAPRTPYARTKAEADAMLLGPLREQGLSAVVLRPYLVYGPGAKPRQLLPALIAACLAERDFPMTDGLQQRDFVYVGDVARAVTLAATAPEAVGHAIDICTGAPRKVADVVQLVVDRIKPARGGPVLGATARPADEPDAHYGDPAPAEARLGWKPEVSLEEGVDRTIDAAREERST
ncbi:NAD-dependent epimerase/dehydratase family protein [Polyangium sp. 6x1]|uniref:NAD-dependent epimerase/dehydratase family protein n=1 Tax=Polyangium sp. 6x1 TaxID=3042689 RepID=UPI002482F6E0|nr:NAD-dependent epimerase/dehydratase family protein [Polyangium sp. 6x1]MDI1450697.1 NAD-dependent epimerase/dehydratase family protein [Polyangium sp. 6x1]